MRKKGWITIAIIVAVIALAFVLLNDQEEETIPKSLAKCIGENSELYTQLGCHACEIQKEMFGENYEHLTVVDCFFNLEACSEISYTPTWIINDKEYVGVQDIETLKELTGCN